MASTKEMQTRAKAKKLAAQTAALVATVTPVKLYSRSQVQQDLGVGTSFVYPEGMQRDTTSIANVIVYDAGSNEPSIRKMTNSGAVYVSQLMMGSAREYEYILEVVKQSDVNGTGVLIQAAIVSDQKNISNDVQKQMAHKVMQSLPRGFQDYFKGQVQTRLLRASETVIGKVGLV
jgi:hypothetical protein